MYSMHSSMQISHTSHPSKHTSKPPRSPLALALCVSLALAAVSVAAPQQPAADHERDQEVAFQPGRETIEIDGAEFSLPWRLLRPDSATAATPKPLVVFLHGAGERGDDNLSTMAHFPRRWVSEPHLGSRHDAFVLVMQCPRNDTWTRVRRDGDGRWLAAAEAPPTSPMLALEQAIARIAQDPAVDRSRIYLTGLSMGGFGAWDLARRRPEWFAAVVPICGGCAPESAPDFVASRVPVWAVHGGADTVVPPSASRDMVEAIRAAGGTVGYTELPGVGHDSWTMAYGPGGCIEWMFAQQRGEPASIPAP